MKRGREGGGTARPQRGWGQPPARSGQDSLSSERPQWWRPTEAGGGPTKGHLGSGSVAGPSVGPSVAGPRCCKARSTDCRSW